VKGFDAATLRRLDGERATLRLPAMRTSIHLLPSENAHLAFRAIRPAMSAQRGRLRYAGVSQERYDQLRDEILETAQEPRTARQLGVDTGEIGERLRAVIHTMTLGGVLLRVGAEGLRSNAPNYVAADTWLGTPGGLPEVGPDEALSWLAGEYLRAFGPAWPEDFRWWAGVSKERAVAALGSVETVEVGDGYLLPSGDRGGFEAVKALERGSVDLLPKWDCYTMGYAPDGRRRFVHPEAQARVYTARRATAWGWC
jgi:hypothetical protein